VAGAGVVVQKVCVVVIERRHITSPGHVCKNRCHYAGFRASTKSAILESRCSVWFF
jgi:hypothetical protein